MATITGNSVYADPTQWWTLDYTFANSKFTWSVTAHASFTSYWNSIYGLTVNVGGNSYYKGDIDWRNYTPNTVVYSGTTNLSDCTVSGGVVTLSVSGNFYYGTWNTDYRSSGSGTCAVDPPTVATLSTPTITNQYSGMTVAGRSVITFRMKGTSQTGSTTMSYSLYQDGSVISTSSGTSGQNKDVTVTAPSAGNHSYYYKATDGNGTTSTSGTLSLTTYAYSSPAFSSVSAVRWSTGDSSGTASDSGTYCKATASFSKGKVGTTQISTTCTIKVSSYSNTATSGTPIWLGSGNLSADNTYTVTFTLADGYGNNVVTTDTLTQGGRGIDMVYSGGHYGVGIGQKATANQVDINMTTRINTGNLIVPNGSIYGGLGNEGTGNGDLTYYQSINSFQGSPANTWASYIICNHGDGSSYYNQTLRLPFGGIPQYQRMVNGSLSGWKSFITEETSTSTMSTSAITRSSGWTINSQAVYQWGRVVVASMILNSSSSVSSGSNCFTGTIASAYKPKTWVSCSAYYISAVMTALLDPNGNIIIRVGGSGSAGGTGDTEPFTFVYLI